MVWEMLFEEFQDSCHGGHLEYRNGTILAILNFHVAPNASLQLSAQSDAVREQIWFEDFQDGRRCGHPRYRNGTTLAILNLHVGPMSSTKFPLNLTCRSGADNNWRFCYDIQDGRHGGHLGYRNNMVLAILNIHVAPMSPVKFWLNSTYVRGQMWFDKEQGISNKERVTRK